MALDDELAKLLGQKYTDQMRRRMDYIATIFTASQQYLADNQIAQAMAGFAGVADRMNTFVADVLNETVERFQDQGGIPDGASLVQPTQLPPQGMHGPVPRRGPRPPEVGSGQSATGPGRSGQEGNQDPR